MRKNTAYDVLGSPEQNGGMLLCKRCSKLQKKYRDDKYSCKFCVRRSFADGQRRRLAGKLDVNSRHLPLANNGSFCSRVVTHTA